MEGLDGNSRQSGILSIINRDKIDRINPDRPYTGPSTMAASSVVSPTSMYGAGPPPPYSSSSWSSSRPTSGLISPPDSRRTSDNKNEPPPPIQIQQSHRQSLPSIHALLPTSAGPKSGPYVSPVSASIPTTHQLPYSESQPPAAPRSYPPNHTPYSTGPSPSQARQPSPPQPIHPQASPFARSEARPSSFSEISRHPSTSAPAPHNPYATTRYEPSRYEQDSRAPDRASNGYQQPPPPQAQQPAYIFGPSPHQTPPATHPGPIFSQPRYDARDSRDPREDWRGKDYDKPVDPATPFRQGIKRHLDVWDFENNLAQINIASVALRDWSGHYNAIAMEQPRSINPIPDRMPTLESVEGMIEQKDKLAAALERMREMIKLNESQMREDQHMREQRGKGIAGYYDDEMSMYGDDMKTHGYSHEGNKKRRGRAAPPGRCHSCNRAETPEWRRGPDGARTLCNACGLHYAKLTRKNTMKQSQSSNGSSLRPKSMDGVSPRPLT